MRQSARREEKNKSVKHGLKTLERSFLTAVKSNKDEARKLLPVVSSALDKAAKTGVIHQGKASRKKSRLAAQLNAKA